MPLHSDLGLNGAPHRPRFRYRPAECAGTRESHAIRLLQELQRHKEELELQNEELLAARAEVEATLDRHIKFYDYAPVGYFALDRHGGILEVNSAGAELLHSERSCLHGKRFALFVELQDRRAFADFLANVFLGRDKACCSVTLRDQDGRWPPVHAHLEATRGEAGLTCSLVAIDMSERKRAELILERHSEELETTVADRTAELSAANRELESFVYAASHDMKAPLARLSSLSSLLGHKIRVQLADSEALTVLDLIQQNALRLNTLVEDLLAHAQIRKQPMQCQPIELPLLVRAVLKEQEEHIRLSGAEVELVFPKAMTVWGDPISLGQIIRNLVENALKYCTKAGTPRIEIGGREENSRCQLWVRDNGIGIDQRYHGLIFEIFRRLHTYSEYPGTGVGLALVKKGIERMGGTVGVISEPGHGATFHLDWPLSPHAGQPDSALAKARPAKVA